MRVQPRFLATLIFGWLVATVSLLGGPANAREPIYLDEVLKPAKLQGSGKLTWWGFHVYDAFFYRSGNVNSSEFALDLRYHRSLSGNAIAERSVEEMKNMGVPDSKAQVWGKELASFLPNIEPGQNITAIYLPHQGTTFYYDGKVIARIPGADFSKAFFGIWLDPKTSAPRLRQQLLGKDCPPPIIQEVCNS